MDQHVKDWCYAECERQHATTTRDILGMEYAWGYAATIESITILDIKRLAEYIDSAANPGGRFRTGPAVFMDGGTAAAAVSIEPYLDAFILSLSDSDITPGEAYKWLMYIHPFKDGNGRVGALVYNILNGTIDNPVTPPEYR